MSELHSQKNSVNFRIQNGILNIFSVVEVFFWFFLPVMTQYYDLMRVSFWLECIHVKKYSSSKVNTCL